MIPVREIDFHMVPWSLRLYVGLTVLHGSAVTIINGSAGLFTLVVGLILAILLLRKVRVMLLILAGLFTIGAVSFAVTTDWLSCGVSVAYLLLLLWPTSREYVMDGPTRRVGGDTI